MKTLYLTLLTILAALALNACGTSGGYSSSGSSSSGGYTSGHS